MRTSLAIQNTRLLIVHTIAEAKAMSMYDTLLQLNKPSTLTKTVLQTQK